MINGRPDRSPRRRAVSPGTQQG